MAKVKCAGDKEIVIPVSNDRTQMSFDATNNDRSQSEERIAARKIHVQPIVYGTLTQKYDKRSELVDLCKKS